MSTSQIILIERDADSRRRLEQWLSGLGREIVKVHTALEAIPKLRGKSTGLILIGLEVNDLRDLVALARIRELPRGRELPIIAVTHAAGTVLGRLQILVSQLHIREIQRKPLVRQALVDAVARALGGGPDAAPSPDPASAVQKPTPTTDRVTREEVAEVYLAMGRQNYFERLGVAEDADGDTIREAFLTKVGRYRPQLVPLSSTEDQRMLRGIYDQLRAAMKVLKTADGRKAYRERLRSPSGGAPAEKAVAEPPRKRRPPPPPVRVATQAVPRSTARTPRDDDVAPPQGAELPPDEIWDRKVAQGRSRAETLAATARVQAVLGDFSGAVDLLREAVHIEPENKDLQYMLELNLGRKFKKLGHPVQARRHLEIAVELSPAGNMHARDELATVQDRPKPKAPAEERRRLRDLFGGWGRKSGKER